MSTVGFELLADLVNPFHLLIHPSQKKVEIRTKPKQPELDSKSCENMACQRTLAIFDLKLPSFITKQFIDVTIARFACQLFVVKVNNQCNFQDWTEEKTVLTHSDLLTVTGSTSK